MIRRTAAALLLAGAGLLTGVGPATAAPSADGITCRTDYASYVDPATGGPFASSGRCLSVVRNGGTLVHIVDFRFTMDGLAMWEVLVYSPTGAGYVNRVIAATEEARQATLAYTGPGYTIADVTGYRQVGLEVVGLPPGSYTVSITDSDGTDLSSLDIIGEVATTSLGWRPLGETITVSVGDHTESVVVS